MSLCNGKIRVQESLPVVLQLLLSERLEPEPTAQLFVVTDSMVDLHWRIDSGFAAAVVESLRTDWDSGFAPAVVESLQTDWEIAVDRRIGSETVVHRTDSGAVARTRQIDSEIVDQIRRIDLGTDSEIAVGFGRIAVPHQTPRWL